MPTLCAHATQEKVTASERLQPFSWGQMPLPLLLILRFHLFQMSKPKFMTSAFLSLYYFISHCRSLTHI